MGSVVLKLYLIVLPGLLAVYHHDTLVPPWSGLCPPLKAHLLSLPWYLWWGILNCVVYPKFTMPFCISIPSAEVILSVILSPLPILFSCLNTCSTSKIPLDIASTGWPSSYFLPLHSQWQWNYLYIPKVPWASLYHRITTLYWSYPFINLFLHLNNKFLSPCLIHTCISSTSMLGAQASYYMLIEMTDAFKESKEGKQGKQSNIYSPCCRRFVRC